MRRRAVGALLAFVGAAAAVGAQPTARAVAWTLDSPASAVQRAEGEASRVERLTSLGYETWHYGAAWVRLAMPRGVVIGWSNPDGRLSVELVPGRGGVGAAGAVREAVLDDVLRRRGTPTSYLPDRLRGIALLRYGAVRVTIDAASHRVLGVEDPDAVSAPIQAPMTTAAQGTLSGTSSVVAPRWPASLQARVALASEGEGGQLEADADVALDVTISNTGAGVARALRVTARGEGSAVHPVGDWPTLDSLAAGASRTLRLTVHIGEVPRDTLLPLEIAIAEAQHFDLDPPLRVQVPVRVARPPRLVLADLAVHDPSGDGRIAPREVVEIVARLQNAGRGGARDVHVQIVPGEGVHLTPDSPVRQAVGSVGPGGWRDVRFSAYSDSRAAGFPVTLEVREARARFDTSLVLPLALNRPAPAGVALLRPREEAPSAAAAPPSLISSVDTAVPRGPLRPGTVAVVLGVERYARAPDAVYAQRDAQTFRRYAQNLFGTGDDAARLFFATNEDVSRSMLHKLFDADGWLGRRTDANTDVVVFIAAHGTVDARSQGAYLLPSDADPAYPVQTGLSLDTLFQRLGALPARSVTVFIDACFSGTTRDGAALVPWTRDVGVSVEHPALRYPHMVVFTAASSRETAMGWDEQRHGLFTYWLLDGLRGAGDANGDGRIDAGELGTHVTSRVQGTAARLGREQSPRLITRDRGALIVRLP